MRAPAVITIDGPAASGKSTLGTLLAQHLNYVFFDTGVLYRALTVVALQRGIALDDPQALAYLARTTLLEVLPPTEASTYPYVVVADGVDVTAQLRDTSVDRNVSTISAYPDVRLALREQQRAIGKRGNIVMVGRDIGSVVMPDAPFKLYLEAPLDERAQRRYAELCEQGIILSLDTVTEDLRRRDTLDEKNMLVPQDAIILQTAGLAPQDEVAHILDLFEQHTDKHALGTQNLASSESASSTR
jgi:cytidylate kinase